MTLHSLQRRAHFAREAEVENSLKRGRTWPRTPRAIRSRAKPRTTGSASGSFAAKSCEPTSRACKNYLPTRRLARRLRLGDAVKAKKKAKKKSKRKPKVPKMPTATWGVPDVNQGDLFDNVDPF